jgi:Tol biopolymer transport system component/DNA-binding winged helix-turn-helix (wHTH) protein
MAEVERQLRLLRFENFEVDLRTGELRKAGVKLKFSGQPFQVLSILLEHPGEVVTRDELQKRLWPDTFVDVDHNLNTAINKIREVLGDSAESPRFVETLPRRGYRFIGELESPVQPVIPLTIPPTIPVATLETDSSRHSPQKWWKIAAIAGCAVAAVMLGWLLSLQHREVQPAPSVKLIPLTSYPGIEQQPSLSPDGSQVAFSWNGPDQTNFDIYVKTTDVKTAGAAPLRLTTNPADDTNPVWSPDGSSIAFLRKINPENQFKLLLMPALGGAERYLADVLIPETGWLYPPYLSWLPDSQSLVITDRPSAEHPAALYLLSARTREKRQLTFPPPRALGDHCAAVSPDGKTLAFRRENAAGQWQGSAYLLGLDNHFKPRGEPRQVAPEPGPVIPNQFFNWSCVAWTADSRRLLFPYDLGLWTVPVSVESAKPISGRATMAIETGNGVNGTTISRISARLAYAFKSGGAQSIWRMGIPRPHEKPEPPVRLIPSTASQFGQQYSPDGSRIAFESGLSGNLEIWLCSSEGQNCAQLTSLGANATGTPTWSPDGKQVAFYSNVEGNSQIYVIPVEGGSTRRLTSDSWGGFIPRWSRNGEWIYFSSKKSGSSQIWKAPAGGGSAVQITHSGGLVSSESPDGKWLYFTGEGTDASLWKVPVAGGEETQVLPSVLRWNYAVMDDGIYFVTRTGHGFAIKFLSFATNKTEVIAPIDDGYFGFSVSPDRKRILYTQGIPLSSELVLAEGFR